MNCEERRKRTQEQNKQDWQDMADLFRIAVSQVWDNMNEILRSRFERDELMNHLWIRHDWAERRGRYSNGTVLAKMKADLWEYMGGTIGGSSSHTPEMNRRLSDGDEEMIEEILHNVYRAEPVDPSDIVADEELLNYLVSRLSREERDIFNAHLSKFETLAGIGKRRRCSERTIRRKLDAIYVKMRRWANEQGW